jgi:hypothetical protein
LRENNAMEELCCYLLNYTVPYSHLSTWFMYHKNKMVAEDWSEVL